MAAKPLRSVLYMPGANTRALEKARSLNADAFIFDLEDAVAPDKKINARENICRAVKQGGYRKRTLVIRINALSSEWGQEDAAAAAAVQPDAILLPKVETAEDIQELSQLITQFGDLSKTAIWAMMETPRGILNAPQIAAAHLRLDAMVMGTSDLVKDLHAAHTSSRVPVLVALGQCLLAARAEGLNILDGVYLNIEDTIGLHEACLQGRDLGFDGKTLIHPRQIETANAVFGPKTEEIEHANQIIRAYDEAMAQGQAVALLDGRLIENLHVEEARRLVALAQTISTFE